MIRNKMAIGLGFGVAMMAGFAQADPAPPAYSTGKINFKGSIVNAACSLKPSSNGQEVDMGQVSATGLLNNNTPVNQFNLELINCDTATLKTVATTFNGTKAGTNNKLLSFVGSARGAGIELTHAGEVLTLGEPTAAFPLIVGQGEATLPFAAQLVATTKVGTEIKAGEFSAVANFTLAYQ